MLYKNVASQKIAVFAYTASTGAAKTGDAAQITAYISKDFAAGAATNDVNPTEMDATNMPGWYVFDLTQAETNAEVIVLAPKSSTSGVVLDQVQVFTQDAAISSRASQTSVDDLPTVVEFEARTLVAADYVVVSDLPSVPTASDNATAAAAAILAAADSDPISANVTYSAGVALAGRLAEYADVNPLALEATAQAILASVNTIDDFLDTEIAAILADTNELQTDLVNGGRLDLLIDAIKAKTDVIPASPAAVGSAMTLTAAYDAAKTAATQTSVDDLPTNAELAAALAAADDAVLAAIAALNNLSSAQAQAAATAALEAYDPPTNAEMVARTLLAASYFDPATDTVARVTLVDTTTTNTDMVAAAPSAATVADAVWDEALSGHAGAGSTGAALSAAGAAGDPWSTALPGAYGAGTAGKLLSDVALAGVTVDPQDVADALKLAPAAGTPATGSVYDLLGDAALEATAQAILEDTGTTLPTAIAAIEPGGGSYAGDGIGYYSDTIDDGTSPLDGVRVQLYTSPNRVGPAYEAYTNALGVFEMWPDPGTYYRWLDLAGYNFSQDVAVTVTEP